MASDSTILTDIEEELEASCRTVECPNCGTRPPRRCDFGLGPKGWPRWSATSHTGRYLVAVDAGLVPPFAGGWRG